MIFSRAHRHFFPRGNLIVSSDLTIRYGILNKVGADLVTKYGILNIVRNDLAVRYDIFNVIGNILKIVYDSAGTVGNSLRLRYSVLPPTSTVQGTSRTGKVLTDDDHKPPQKRLIIVETPLRIRASLTAPQTAPLRIGSRLYVPMAGRIRAKSESLAKMVSAGGITAGVSSQARAGMRIEARLESQQRSGTRLSSTLDYTPAITYLENFIRTRLDDRLGYAPPKHDFVFVESAAEWQGILTEQRFRAFTHSSSFVGNVRYDQDLQQMVIILNGKEYTFCNVPERVFDAFSGANSKGAFFNRNIKGQYNC